METTWSPTHTKQQHRHQARQAASRAAALERRIMQFDGFAYGVDDWLQALQRAAELWHAVSELPGMSEDFRRYARLRSRHCAHPATQMLVRSRYLAHTPTRTVGGGRDE